MFASALISLSASVLITASTFVSMASGFAGPASHTLDGLPVTDLPGITVYPASAQASPRDAGLIDRLADSAATQVANSHLGMPYYSFGSGNGQNGKD